MMTGKHGTIEERFWPKVDKSGGPDACWLWTGSKDKGYGKINSPWRKVDTASRVAYRLCIGPIPDGMDVCHTCDNPPCVNPKHLFAGTRKQNLEDAAHKGRMKDNNKAHKRSGSGNGRAKLVEADVLAIRAAYAGGESMKSLARHYSISDSAIEFIVHRKHWRHI
jgi:hypothetical protein